MKTLDEYEQIAIETFGAESHAVTWIRAQKANKGTLDLSHESMMKMLERMNAKSAVVVGRELPPSESEFRRPPTAKNPTTSMFAKLKKEQKS